MIGAELNYTVQEQELLAIVEMIERHRHWLIGVTFVINTDHRSIEHLQTQATLNRRQARWVISLHDFDMVIKYFPGEKNTVADLLSRSTDVQPLCLRCKQPIDISAVRVSPLSSVKSQLVTCYATDRFAMQLETWSRDKASGQLDAKETALFNCFAKRGSVWM